MPNFGLLSGQILLIKIQVQDVHERPTAFAVSPAFFNMFLNTILCYRPIEIIWTQGNTPTIKQKWILHEIADIK